MNELEAIFSDLFAFIEELVKDYGEPISPTPEEFQQLKKQIVENPMNQDKHVPKQFFLIERVAGEILFSHNLDKFLGLSGDFDLMQFHSYIDDGTSDWTYLKDYLTWGKAAYMFFTHFGKIHDLRSFSYKLSLPMRLIDGRIYWVNQESHPLEFDKDNNMISHINTYTISGLYKEPKPVDLTIEIHYKDLYRNDWSDMLAENRYAIRPFSISAIQNDILLHYNNTPKANTVTCSLSLKYPRNTIKKYISDSRNKTGIIDRARVSFPHISFNTMSDVVHFLQRLGWFKNMG
jgi:hypothetical protein